jgi:hypothetical protein
MCNNCGACSCAKKSQKKEEGGMVTFLGYTCRPVKGLYGNSRLALRLVDAETGAPVATATVNVPEQPLAEGEVIIRDYAENTGILKALVAAGVVQATGDVVPVGPFGRGVVARLLI